MRQVLVDADRTTVSRLQDVLLTDFPELPAGLVLGTVTRSRRDLSRLGPCEGLWDAVELVARQRLLEALALGTPAVSTPVTGIPEIVRHEETGLLVPESDPGALATAIARIVDEPAESVRRALAARELLEADFDFRDHAVTLQGIFREAIASRADAPTREREVA